VVFIFPFEIVIVLRLVLILIASLYLVVESGGGYWKYRKSISNAKKKEEQYHKEDGINAPGKDEDKIINEIDPAIIPNEDPLIDSTIVS
jgi:hypothetical protein